MSDSFDHRIPEDHTGRIVSGLTEFSLKRRITVLVILMSIVVVGIIATLGIPVELFPRGFTSQSLFVGVPQPNAPTQQVLDKIKLPLEEASEPRQGRHGCRTQRKRFSSSVRSGIFR